MSAGDLRKDLRAVGSYFSRAFRAWQNYVVGMTIWIMAVLLFALFGALGYAKGAIRMIFPLMGLALGAFLAVPLGPWANRVGPLLGWRNPIWTIRLPRVFVSFRLPFFLFSLG